MWSGIMCKSFKYGDNPSSSAAIESQFNDLKFRVLKHVSDMPIKKDDFLSIHIESLDGSMKFVNAKINSQTPKNNQVNGNEKLSIMNGKSSVNKQSLDDEKLPMHSISSYLDQSSTHNKFPINNEDFQFPINQKTYGLEKITDDICM